MDDQKIKQWELEQEAKMSMWRAEWEAKLAKYHADNTWDIEMFKSVINAGQAALKCSLLINGGAAVAMLAFITNIFNSNENIEIIAHLADSILCFTAGLLFGAIATGLTYFAQWLYQCSKNKTATTLNIVSNVFVIFSYLLFSLGVWIVYKELVP